MITPVHRFGAAQSGVADKYPILFPISIKLQFWDYLPNITERREMSQSLSPKCKFLIQWE